MLLKELQYYKSKRLLKELYCLKYGRLIWRLIWRLINEIDTFARDHYSQIYHQNYL